MFQLWYTKRYYLTHPHELVKDITLNIKWAWQRVYRGWDDRVAWGIDQHLFEQLPQWLSRLKETYHGISPVYIEDAKVECDKNGNCSDEDFNYAKDYYEFVLDQMIDGFNAGHRLVSDDLDVYDEFVAWQIETYGKEVERDITEDDSGYLEAYNEFDMRGRMIKEIDALRMRLDVALGLFLRYHETLWD